MLTYSLNQHYYEYSYRASPSKEHATVRITGGVSITPKVAEPVRDSWVMSLLSEDLRDNVVQVSIVNKIIATTGVWQIK